MDTATKTIFDLKTAQPTDQPLARIAKLACPKCGVDASCDCGVAPILKAEAAIAANPEKSNRAIAAELGVSDMTVGRARKSTATDVAVEEKRIGRDGKARKMPEKRKEPTTLPLASDKSPGELREAVQGFKAAMDRSNRRGDAAKCLKWRTVGLEHLKVLITHSDLPRVMEMTPDEIVFHLNLR